MLSADDAQNFPTKNPDHSQSDGTLKTAAALEKWQYCLKQFDAMPDADQKNPDKVKNLSKQAEATGVYYLGGKVMKIKNYESAAHPELLTPQQVESTKQSILKPTFTYSYQQ